MYGGIAFLFFLNWIVGVSRSFDRFFTMDSHVLSARGIDSGSRQATVFGVGIGFMAFISMVIALRVYARAVILRAMGVDDGMPSCVHLKDWTDIEQYSWSLERLV